MNYEQLTQDIIDGNENPLKGYAIMKKEIARLTKCLKEIEPAAHEEAGKHGNNTFSEGGFKFERRNGGAVYNFKNIPEWATAKESIKTIEDRAKTAFANYKKGITSTTEDGEIIALPEVTYKKDSLIVK